MRLLSIAVVFVLPMVLFGQNQQEPSAAPTPQQLPGDPAMPPCPVHILSARIEPRRNPQPLLDPKNMQTRRVFGTVHIHYMNDSPKNMRDVEVGVHFQMPPHAAPPVPQTLDPNAEYLTLPGLRPGQSRWTTQPVTLEVKGLLSVQPTGATFVDGTTWQAPDSGTNLIPENGCSWTPPAQMRPAHDKVTPAR